MKSTNFCIIVLALFCILLAIPVNNFTKNLQERPPEYTEYMKAMQIKTPEEKLKELKQIKEKYPNSIMMQQIDMMIYVVKIDISTSIDQILEAQKTLIQSEMGSDIVIAYLYLGKDLLKHKKLDDFDSEKVLHAILNYAEMGKKFANDPKFLENVSTSQKKQIKSSAIALDMIVAAAYIHVKNEEKALEYLEKYRESGGTTDGEYYYHLGLLNELQDNKKEAFNAYFEAAGKNYEDSQEKARALFKEINGNLDEFESMLEAKLTELPFHPEPFRLTREWKGKTALVELFTGAECPPCVAVDLAFDCLLEAYDSKYLAVLVYHLPIPGPDPMMNPATHQRRLFYNVNSTPTTFFNGIMKHRGGGSRSYAKKKFDQYIKSINPVISRTPRAQLKVSATLEGDIVKVTWSSDKELEAVNYNFALLQKEEKYIGRNGIYSHKMVVRDFKSLESDLDKKSKVIFNIPEIEKSTEKHLNDYAKKRKITFKKLLYKIDRTQLQVISFLQDKDTKMVHNASVCDVVVKQ